jgi:HlyD family secretion protein
MANHPLLKRRRNLVVAGVAGAVILALAGFVLHGRSDEPRYLTTPVTRGDITALVQATGTINPLTTVPVGSYVSGTVKYIFADFNTHVHAGQVLAQLDPAVYEAQVIQARGNLANLQASIPAMEAVIAADQANVVKQKANVQYLQATARRSTDLFNQGIISADQNDLTQSNLAQGQASVRQAEAELRQAQEQLRQSQAQVQAMLGALKLAEANLRYTTILSPIDGVIVARNITVGQSVAASLQAPTLFTIAQDLKRMQVDTQVDESDTGHMALGTEATFQVDALPHEIFRGRVSAIRLNATIVQNVVTYDVVINFDNPQEKLLPGETAYVSIPVGHAADTLEIPNTALTYTPNLARDQLLKLYSQFQIPRQAYTNHLGGWQVVWKLGPKNQLVPVGVQVGITDYNHTQVLAGDLKQGDAVVTGQLGPANGQGAAGGLARPPGRMGPGGR